MVWFQKFEYAVGHWLQKTAEHVLGCVLCSPGCFSLFRGKALVDVNVMRQYATPPSEALHYVQWDQGKVFIPKVWDSKLCCILSMYWIWFILTCIFYLHTQLGEDRWLCTLLLKRGWRIEYSAASDSYTYAPEEFNEFFNQRRRYQVLVHLH